MGTVAAVISLAASSPSIPGIRTSISTTSGRSAAACATAAAPSAASPATVMPSAVSSITQNPGSHQLLVVDHEHPDRVGPRFRSHRAGSRAATANPSPGVGPTVRLPPHEATRSTMPARPNPEPARPAGPPGLGAAIGRGHLPWRPVVGNGNGEVAGLVSQRDEGTGRCRVAQGVGQGLLNDPVRGQVDAGSQRVGSALHVELNG